MPCTTGCLCTSGGNSFESVRPRSRGYRWFCSWVLAASWQVHCSRPPSTREGQTRGLWGWNLTSCTSLDRCSCCQKRWRNRWWNPGWRRRLPRGPCRCKTVRAGCWSRRSGWEFGTWSCRRMRGWEPGCERATRPSCWSKWWCSEACCTVVFAPPLLQAASGPLPASNDNSHLWCCKTCRWPHRICPDASIQTVCPSWPSTKLPKSGTRKDIVLSPFSAVFWLIYLSCQTCSHISQPASRSTHRSDLYGPWKKDSSFLNNTLPHSLDRVYLFKMATVCLTLFKWERGRYCDAVRMCPESTGVLFVTRSRRHTANAWRRTTRGSARADYVVTRSSSHVTHRQHPQRTLNPHNSQHHRFI